MKLASPEANRLMRDGALALANIEANGMKIDVPYLDRTMVKVENRIERLTDRLKQDKIFKMWQKVYRRKTNLGSRDQLGRILFDEMKLPCHSRTEKTKRPSMDIANLERLDEPFVKHYLQVEKLKKLYGTYLKGIRREVEGEYLRPSYNLHLARTYRPSCDHPNFQNIPVRDKVIGKLVRRAFIPRPGRMLVEVDYSGIEVGIAACVVGDTMLETIDGAQTIREVILRLGKGENVFVYGYDLDKKRVAISKVIEGGKTRIQAKVWKVTLDNGEEIVATPDHEFLLRDGTYVPLCKLRPGMSLMPFYKRKKRSPWKTVYSEVYMNDGRRMLEHNLIALDVLGVKIEGSKVVVHHKDGNGTNNGLSNLEVMRRQRHMSIHSVQGWKRKGKGNRFRWSSSEKGRESIRRMNRHRRENWSKKDWKEFGKRVSEGIRRKGGRKGKKNSMYGKEQSWLARWKISLAKKGKKTGKSAWNRGCTKSTHSSVRKISIARMGQAAWNKGKKLSPLTEECKSKISASLRGRVFTEEHRRKLSLNKLEYWSNKEFETCGVCQGKFKTITNTHLSSKHNLTLEKYKETYNHEVVSVGMLREEDVYNITVEGIHNYALGAGVVVRNCYHRDPTMLQYLEEGYDLHRDMAAECYMLEADQVSKDVRFYAKNQFVFPQFYGDYYVSCAKNLWEAMRRAYLKTSDGNDLETHLGYQGIDGPRQFENHIKQVEERFWNDRFPVYRDWKDEWWEKYQKCGYLRLKTGFVCQGIYRRNEAINYPIQGSAFHCLLWSLIRMNRWLVKNKMETMIVGQIYDSMILDVVEEERGDVLAMAKQIMTVDLRRAWPWIVAPLEIDAEGSDRNWHEKMTLSI